MFDGTRLLILCVCPSFHLSLAFASALVCLLFHSTDSARARKKVGVREKHTNSQQAVEMVHKNAAFVVTMPNDVTHYLEEIFGGETLRLAAGQASSEFVKRNIGATGRFLARLEKAL